MRIVAFGTSLTARGGWPLPLQDALTACLEKVVTVEIVAHSGATSAWAVSAVGDVVSAQPDIVLMEFYANDAALNRLMTIGDSRRNVSALIRIFKRDLPAARVIVMAMNPFSGVRAAMRPFVDDYIAAHRALALDAGFEFFDNRPGWLALPLSERARAIPDGLHPVPEVAARVMLPGLTEAIAGKPC